MDEYLQNLRRELNGLGPLERAKVLREVRADILELVERRGLGLSTADAIQSAIREMPAPFEVAQEYLSTHRAPLSATRLASALNLGIGLIAFILAAMVLQANLAANGLWASNLPMVIVAATLLVASSAIIAVYAVVILSARRVVRWRFAILPAAAISLIADGLLVAEYSAFDWRVGMAVLVATLLGGAYSVSYVHGQLARVDSQDFQIAGSGDYYRAVAKGLRDLDRGRRQGVLSELRSHVEATGVDLSRLEPAARRARLEAIIGSADEIATAYLEKLEEPLPRRWRLGLRAAVLLASLGFVVGSVVLGIGIDLSVREGGYFTLVGLASSVGLLGFSAVLLAKAMRVHRAPVQREDHGLPMLVATTATILILSMAAVALPSGGLIVQGNFVRHEVLGSAGMGDGKVGVLWYSFLGDDSWRVIDSRGPVLGAWVTVVDPNGIVEVTEPFPGNLPNGPLLDFARSNDSWMALFSDSLVVWGAVNRTVPLASSPWDSVDGHLNGSVARIGRIARADRVIQVAFERVDLSTPGNGLIWQQNLSLANATDPRVKVSDAAILVTALVHENNATQARARLSGFLIGENGGPSTPLILHERVVPLAFAGDTTNGTWIGLDDVHARKGYFWLAGGAGNRTNGTGADSQWAARVDAGTGAAVEWDLHQVSLPEAYTPPKTGDRMAIRVRESAASADRLFVVSFVYGLIADAGGAWQPDGNTSRLLVSSLFPNGTVEYALRIDQGRPLRTFVLPLVTVSEEKAIVLAFPLPDPAAPLVYSFGPIVPSGPIESRTIALRFGEATLLYHAIATQRWTGLQLGPTVAGIPGEGFLQDSGFLGWRGYISSPTRAFVSIPAILKVDAWNGTARLVPFADAPFRPDPLLDLASATIITVLGILLLSAAYPRWRLTLKHRHPA